MQLQLDIASCKLQYMFTMIKSTNALNLNHWSFANCCSTMMKPTNALNLNDWLFANYCSNRPRPLKRRG